MGNTQTKAAETRKDFESLKRDFETAHASGRDFSDELINLSVAIAAACIKKCADPQRKTAAEMETVSQSGMNPAMLALRRGLYQDIHLLADTRTNSDNATSLVFNQDGDPVKVTADHDALEAFGGLIGETLTDGLDLANTAAMTILEQSVDHAGVENWLDAPYTVRRLSKKVYIQSEDTAAYRDDITTPIQEAYKAVRRAIQASRAAQTDPRNGYSYIEELTADGLDTIYHRLQKWADLGGYSTDGHYTTGEVNVETYEDVIKALNLSDRQLSVINLRMRGYGKKAIGTYLGVDSANVGRVIRQVQAKAEKIGFTPSMWAEMTRED